jgi:hypothetical protein
MTPLHALALALASLLPDAGLTPAEVDLGAAMVCAEARGESAANRRAVAAVLRNRVRASGRSLAGVALAKGQFAKPCPARAVLPEHRADFIAGWLGFGLPRWWSGRVVSFQTHRSARETHKRWTKTYRWRRVDRGELAHTFWEGGL